MDPEVLQQDIFEDETLAAFIGALDDIAAATVEDEAAQALDDEIAQRVLGLFDTASTFYAEDMVRNMELVNGLAARLGAMACAGHSHMGSAFDVLSDMLGIPDLEPSHEHDDDDEDDED